MLSPLPPTPPYPRTHEYWRVWIVSGPLLVTIVVRHWPLTISSWSVQCYRKIVMNTTQLTHWVLSSRQFLRLALWNSCEKWDSSTWYERSNILYNPSLDQSPNECNFLTSRILHKWLLEDCLWDDRRGLHDKSFWEKPDSFISLERPYIQYNSLLNQSSTD